MTGDLVVRIEIEESNTDYTQNALAQMIYDALIARGIEAQVKIDSAVLIY